ncbi:MAG: hypothetical protein ABJD68_17240 [Nakamurella sp.]
MTTAGAGIPLPLDARDDGLFGSATVTSALEVLDPDQINLELNGDALQD